MIKLKPKFIYDKNNKKTEVLLTPKEFGRIIEALDDFQDYTLVEERRCDPNKTRKTYTREEMHKKLSDKK